MKKKVPAKDKSSHSKTKQTKAVKPSPISAKSSVKPAASKLPVKVDPAFAQAVQNYEAGVKALQQQKFDKAKGFFEKVIEGPRSDLADRARLNLRICDQQMDKSSSTFKNPEEHYDYAVSLMNSGDYDTARTHLEKLVRQNSKMDHAVYAMSVLDCLTNRIEDALRNLHTAILLNPNNRFQARNDSDFANMADDPRFTELLYPEAGSDSESAYPGASNKRR